MIFFAIPVLLAAFAIEGPVWLVFCPLLLIPVFHLRREQLVIPFLSLLIGFIAFFYFQYQGKQKPPAQVTELIWTDNYRIDGDQLRGFARSPDGFKWYATYQFKNEFEKSQVELLSLSGANFSVDAEIVELQRPAHQYAFNMEKYIRNEGAVGHLSISKLQFTRMEKGFMTRMAGYRKNMQQHIQQTFPQSLSAEAEALIIGERTNFDPIDERAFVVLGISHLFAISGLHIGMLTFMVYGLLFRLGFRKETINLTLLIGLPVYAVLAGAAPSVWRAVLMIELLLLASRFNRKIGLDDAISISLIVFVFLTPSSVFQAGFQLSYAAAFSLIYSSSILKGKSAILTSFLITVICQLMVSPLILYHFYEISLSSFLMNIVFVPIFSFVILPANIILLLLTFLPGNLSDWLFAVYTPIRDWLRDMIRLLAQIPYQLWNPGKLSILQMFLLSAGVFTLFLHVEQKKYRKGFMFIVIPIVLIQLKPFLHATTNISFIDVGQGDSILIEMPFRRETYLIDTGGRLSFGSEDWRQRQSPFEVGRQIVVPYLKGKGISKLDRLILTHADADHAEGADEIVEEIRVKEIHVTPNSIESTIMDELFLTVTKQDIPIVEVKEGNGWELQKYRFTYLSPTDHLYEGNNDSLVLLMESREFRALFTGDLEGSGEEELIRKYKSLLEEITILKAGHHGSKTSSTLPFLQMTRPKLTIFSAGKNNRYGHPHTEVVDRFQQLSLRTLSTAEEGTIMVTIAKGKWSVRNM